MEVNGPTLGRASIHLDGNLTNPDLTNPNIYLTTLSTTFTVPNAKI